MGGSSPRQIWHHIPLLEMKTGEHFDPNNEADGDSASQLSFSTFISSQPQR